MGAYRRGCFSFGVFSIFGFGFVALLSCLADARPLAAEDLSRSGVSSSADNKPPSQTSRPVPSFVITSSLDLLTGEIVTHEHHREFAAGAQEAQQQPQQPTDRKSVV